MSFINTKNRPSGQADLSDLLGCTGTYGNVSTRPNHPDNLAQTGCDIAMTVSLFSDVKAQQIEPNRLSLRQLQQRLTQTTAPDKSALPLVKLAIFGDARTEKGSLRHDANLLSISGVEGDYDAGQVTMQEAAMRLEGQGIAAMIYTTPSHTLAAPRWRVLAPLAVNVTPADRSDLCSRLNGALGGILASESFTPSQSYYFGNVTGKPVESCLVEGQPLDLATHCPKIGPKSKPVVSSTDLSDLFRTPADRKELKRALAFVPDNSDYYRWLEIGMALHHEFSGSDEGFAHWCEWASKDYSLFSSSESSRKWKGFKAGKTTIGTLLHIAAENGYARPSTEYFESDFEDLPPLPQKKAKAPSKLTFLSPEDCENAQSRGYLIKGFLAPYNIACIFGAPGAGKSLISPYLGYMVAQGNAAFQMRTKQGGVFYVAAEDSYGMRGRIKALKKAHGDAPEFIMVDGVSQLVIANTNERAPDLVALVHAVKAQRPALIFIDTLAMAFPGLEENSAEAMGRVVAVSKVLAYWGAAVVLIHHDAKSEGGTPRGHSLFNGALDVALHVKRDAEGIIRGKLTKNRNGPCDRDIAFTIATEDGGLDEDEESITLPRCNPLLGSARTVKGPTGQSAAALKVLEAMPLPASREDWKHACMASDLVCATDNPETRRKAFDRALVTLARGELIKSHDGFYSIQDSFDEKDGHGQIKDNS
uniref:AAA family ATPase n=2 Tax=Yoonia sp. TaxID=2212373 RepID=UPI00404744AF